MIHGSPRCLFMNTNFFFLTISVERMLFYLSLVAYFILLRLFVFLNFYVVMNAMSEHLRLSDSNFYQSRDMIMF